MSAILIFLAIKAVVRVVWVIPRKLLESLVAVWYGSNGSLSIHTMHDFLSSFTYTFSSFLWILLSLDYSAGDGGHCDSLRTSR